jgi:hypothetical protein
VSEVEAGVMVKWMLQEGGCKKVGREGIEVREVKGGREAYIIELLEAHEDGRGAQGDLLELWAASFVSTQSGTRLGYNCGQARGLFGR